MSQSNIEIIQAHCPDCDGFKQCTVECKRTTEWVDEELPCEKYTYFLLKCCGCNRFFFQEISICDYYERDEDGNISPDISIYPPPYSQRTEVHKARIDIRSVLQPNFFEESFASKLYWEVCYLLNQQHLICAALGMRTLIDTVCVIKTGYNKNFSKNLQKLVDDGYLAIRQKDLFEKILNIGHGATHRQIEPELAHLKLCIKSIEHLIEALFILPRHEQEIDNILSGKSKKSDS